MSSKETVEKQRHRLMHVSRCGANWQLPHFSPLPWTLEPVLCLFFFSTDHQQANFAGVHKNCAQVNNTPPVGKKKSKILEIKRWDATVKAGSKNLFQAERLFTLLMILSLYRWMNTFPKKEKDIFRWIEAQIISNHFLALAVSKAAWAEGRKICLRALHFCPSLMRIKKLFSSL